jgi:hypothetical protein
MLVPWRALRRSTAAHPRRLTLSASLPVRPYAFHIGVSFVGKPDEGDELLHAHPRISKPFPTTHPVVPFREEMLAWKKEVPSNSAGQDFFYAQEVRRLSLPLLRHGPLLHCVSCADGKPLGAVFNIVQEIVHVLNLFYLYCRAFRSELLMVSVVRTVRSLSLHKFLFTRCEIIGWSEFLDPSLFSQALMCYASRAASTNWPGEPHRDPLTDEETQLPGGVELSPVDIMRRAFKVCGLLRICTLVE